ncbi:MAG: hypothetical protein WA950_06905 [Shinella sp.]|uniref:hypothetical protein n=1 Tax=Shinella sp. TaxID=1870904 RepID=UPI003C74398E
METQKIGLKNGREVTEALLISGWRPPSPGMSVTVREKTVRLTGTMTRQRRRREASHLN